MMSSTDRLEALAEQINRILAVPYTVSLHKLANTLRDTEDDTLVVWLSIKSCQVPALASKVASTIYSDECAAYTLLSLSRLQLFRDLILLEHPMVLRDAIDQVSRTPHHQVCNVIFSRRLPLGYDLPLALQTYRDDVIANVQKQPLNTWIQQTFSILNAVPEDTLHTMSEDKWRGLLNSWSSSVRIDDSPVFVASIAVGAILRSHITGTEQQGTFRHLRIPVQELLCDWIQKTDKMFDGEKVPKIIKRILLSVLRLISDESSETPTNVANGIEMASSALKRMNSPALRDALVADSILQKIIIKLVEKAENLATASSSQLAMYALLTIPELGVYSRSYSGNSTFLDESMLIEAVIQGTGNCETICRYMLERQQPSDSTPQQRYQEHKKAFVHAILNFVVNECAAKICVGLASAKSLQRALELLHTLSSVGDEIYEIQEWMTEWMQSTGTSEWWTQDHANAAASVGPCTRAVVCTHVAERNRMMLITELSNKMIRAASTTTRHIRRQDFDRLLCRIQSTTVILGESTCRFPSWGPKGGELLPTQQISMSSESDTMTGPLELTQDLALISTQISDTVRRHVEGICHDLQNRCDSIEAPLRAKQERIEHLQKQIAELNSTMEESAVAYEAEQQAWLAQFEHERSQLSDISTCVDRLQDEKAELEEALLRKETYAQELDRQVRVWSEKCQSLQSDLAVSKIKEKKMFSLLSGIQEHD